MIRRSPRVDGSIRFDVYGRRNGKKVYVSSHNDEADAIEAEKTFKSRQKQASAAVVAFKLYAVHANGAESQIIHDTLSDDHRTYDVDINGKTRGIWIAPISAETVEAKPSRFCFMCNEPSIEVYQLVQSKDGFRYICDECVYACADLLASNRRPRAAIGAPF